MILIDNFLEKRSLDKCGGGPVENVLLFYKKRLIYAPTLFK